MAAATGITLAVAAITFAGVCRDPALATELMGPFAEQVRQFAEAETPAGRYFADQAFVKALGGARFSAFLFTHNLKVALLAFALGVSLGVLTVAVLISNAIMLGAFIAIGVNVGHGTKLLSVIAPHGALELPAIFIAAGAGLLIGHAMIAPGRWRRVDALRIVAKDALNLLVVTVPLFLAAGIIEGNISPRFRGLFASDIARFGFACLVFAVMAAYLLAGDRLLPPHRRTKLKGRYILVALE